MEFIRRFAAILLVIWFFVTDRWSEEDLGYEESRYRRNR